MANKSLSKLIKNDQAKFVLVKGQLLSLIGEEAVNFFTQNFRRQGFLDDSVDRWKPREKSEAGDRGILIGKGGSDKLSKSIKKLLTKRNSVIIGSTKIYAGVHNYGLKAGRGKGFKMRQRKFVGDSRTLNKKIAKLVRSKLKQAFS